MRVQKILIAEDEAVLREAYVTILQHAGYEVAEAGDGCEVLEQMDRVCPDLLILDMLMPKKGGLEVLADERMQPFRESVKIIAFTNLSDPETLDALRKMRVDKYLLKSSMTLQALIDNVSSVLGGDSGGY